MPVLELEDVTKKKDLTDFYRNVLDSTTRTVPLPGELGKKGPSTPPPSKPTNEPSISKSGVKLNDAEEVVDKRDLLGAGLNVVKKPMSVQERGDTGYRPAAKVEHNRKRGTREDETRRVLEMVETQRMERGLLIAVWSPLESY